MAALDLTTLTLTNPNSLITSVLPDAVVWDGQTHDSGATRLHGALTPTSESYVYKFNLGLSSYGPYKSIYLFARSAGVISPTSSDPAAYAHFVRLYFNGSGLELNVGANHAGTVTSSSPMGYSGGVTVNNGYTYDCTLTYDKAAGTLTLEAVPKGGSVEGTKTVSLTGLVEQTHDTLQPLVSHTASSTTDPWGGTVSAVDYALSAPAAPTLSGRVTSSTSATATLPVSGTDGTVFAVAVPPTGSATTPTGAQIEASTDGAGTAAIGGSTPVTAAGDIDVALTGLTANTEYTVYAVHKALDGTYGAVVSTTVTPNPVLSGTLETGADTPYADGGSWLIGILNADMTGITTAMVTPDATGAIRIVDSLLPVSTEVVIASIAPDGTNGVIGKLTTSA